MSEARPVTNLIGNGVATLLSAKWEGELDLPVTSAPKPKAVATQLDQAFSSANVEVKKEATVASEALRTANYEEALHSLYTVRKQGNLTLEQGMAVHNSMVALEGALIGAINAGDPKAKRAYELLRELSRD